MLPSGPTSAMSSGHAGLDGGGAIRAAVSRGDEGASLSSFVLAVIVCVEEVKRALLFLPIYCCIVRLRLFSLSFFQEYHLK